MKKYILWIWLAVFCSVILSCQTGKENKAKPNILIIYADQRSKHGLLNALMPVNMNEQYLDVSEKTLAEFLKSDGYKTAIFGKWHLGFQNEKDMPESHGFDEFAGFRGGCIDYFTNVYGQMGHDWYVDGKEITSSCSI